MKNKTPEGPIQVDDAKDFGKLKLALTVLNMSPGELDAHHSKRQHGVTALSSCEAEIIALTQGGKIAIYIQQFLESIGIKAVTPTTLWEDNKSAIELATNAKFHDRSKHISVRHLWIREYIKQGNLITKYLPTGQMTADILTKALARNLFERHRQSLNVRLDMSILGGVLECETNYGQGMKEVRIYEGLRD